MASIIEFFIKYNSKLIFISFTIICILAAMVVWWQVFGKKGLQTGEKPDLDLSDIENSLQKILNQTNVAIGNVSAQVGGAASDENTITKLDGVQTLDGRPIENLAAVKTELQVRAKIIEDLQIQVKSSKAGGSGEVTAEMLAKIRDLEGKLAEYEIIEDDIADLSFFKEENLKLKKELESIKRAGPQMVDQFAEALGEDANEVATSVDATASSESVAEVESARPAEIKGVANAVAEAVSPAASHVSPEQAEVDAMMAAAAEEASLNPATAFAFTGPITDADIEDVLQASHPSQPAISEPETIEQLDNVPAPEEFEATAKAATAADDAMAEAVSAAQSMTPSAIDAGEKAEGEPSRMQGESDDIFGEFAAGEESVDPLAVLGEIDPDKMLDELKGLNGEFEAGVEALEESPDIEKLADEAVNLKAKG